MEKENVYQGRLFNAIFCREEHKSWLLPFYNLLNGSEYENPDDLEVMQFDDKIFLSVENDKAIMLDVQMHMYEFEYSWSPALGMLGVIYFSQFYQHYLFKHRRDTFWRTKVKIPAPLVFILHNDSKETFDKRNLKLSESYKNPEKNEGNEWTTKLLNFSSDHNKDLFLKCPQLNDYAQYVNCVKENVKNGLTRENAVEKALTYAVEKNLLGGLFSEHQNEIFAMTLAEFD